MTHVALTAGQTAEFEARMRHWQQRLGLADWRIERVHTGRAPSGAMAEVGCNYDGRLASYRVGKFPPPVADADIDRIALHETLHVLLAELIHVAENDAKPPVLASAEHRVIHSIINLLAP